MEKKKKLIILGVTILILAISGLTYAILTWTSSKINIGLTSGCFTIDYTKGQDISGNLKLLNESDLISNNKFTIKNGIGISAVNIGVKSTCTIEGFGSIYLNVTNISDAFTTGDSKGALKYVVLDNTSTITTPSSVTVDSLLNQSFEIVAKGSIESSGKKLLYKMELSNTEINKYIIVIYVDNALAGNSITSATFSGNISADAEQQISSTPDYCFTLGNKNETNKTASIIDYLCYEGNSNGYETITDVSIPESITGYKIIDISPESSMGCNYGNLCVMNNKNLTKVILPNTLLTIGTRVFSNNYLTDIVIPDSVTNIGTGVFESNQLSNVKIPDSVTTIGDSAFGNNRLTNIVIPSSITTIGDSAFESNQLTSIAIPNSVTTLGSYAFRNNRLTSIAIPNSVTTLGYGSFFYNPLISIYVDSNNSVYDSRNNCNAIIETSSNELIQGSKNTIIPNSVTIIGTSAFSALQLTGITIPDSVTTIKEEAFRYNKLTSITIPYSVTTIGQYAFTWNNLSYVLINSNSNLTTINSIAFSSSNDTSTSTFGEVTYLNNPNLKIYNNSGKAFDWNKAVNGTSGTTFVTGTTNVVKEGNRTYNAVTVTTGQPSYGDR